jgi:CBS-domain-containing membrane protein
VVDNGIDPLEPTTPLAEITLRMATYNLVCMPVVDSADRLVGAVTVDDLLDHLLPPHWRDRDQPALGLGAHVVPHLAQPSGSPVADPVTDPVTDRGAGSADSAAREGDGRG